MSSQASETPVEKADIDPDRDLSGAASAPTTHQPIRWGLWLAAATLVVLFAVGIWARFAIGDAANAIQMDESLSPPSAQHWMGTDELGRDIFTRFLVGAGISLTWGSVIVIVGALLGGVIGVLAGVFGGFVDDAAMRTMDAILAFPPLFLAMAVTVGLGTGLRTAAIGLTVGAIPWYSRVARAEVLRLRALPFVEATVAIGAKRTRVVARHVLPHVAPTLVIQAGAAFGSAILGMAALGFVGLGAQIPTPEWGAMITAGLQYTLTGQWWLGVFPGLGLLAVVTSAGILAEGIRHRLDPKSGD